MHSEKSFFQLPILLSTVLLVLCACSSKAREKSERGIPILGPEGAVIGNAASRAPVIVGPSPSSREEERER